ncbi:MAG: hypothetical protein DLM73_00030 [Chthoniobacterales bacterium]|nr:MAG: hypothetical protein DLM73_00030 [Chthoniobacterales bacterium]
MRILVLLVALLLSGCILGKGNQTARNNFNPAGPWGYYSGPIDTRWDADGRTMTLLNELHYTDPKGVVWIAPAGSVIDGASIPRALWSFMGGPFEGRYRNASVLHDVAYDQKSRPPAETDRMFYNAMRCSGVGVVEAKTMYYALFRHGHHWRAPRIFAGAKAQSENNVPRAAPVEEGELAAAKSWIENANPSLAQIEARAGQR